MNADDFTLMQIVEFGWTQPDGPIEWAQGTRRPDTSANRNRILKRDAEYPTGDDGWKIVPQSLIDGRRRYMMRIRWEDIRFYSEEHR